MALNKREFVNGSQPPIDADFLNELQDAVIDLEENGGGASGTGATETTEVDYGNLSEEEKMADVFYMIPNGVPSTRKAVNTQYDNSTSGLSADNVQGAIDEVSEDLKPKRFSVGTYATLEVTGNIAILQFNGTPVSSESTIGVTIDSKYYPKTDVITSSLIYTGGLYQIGFAQLNTAGTLMARYYAPNVSTSGAKPTSGSAYGNMTWTFD